LVDTRVILSTFEPGDREEVRTLILAGLGERWGVLDPAKNPDLDDIATSYAAAYFLVARVDGHVVGTGALVPRTAGTAEIVRMSVAAGLRKQGIGGQILRQLLQVAQEAGYHKVILETTATWHDAIRFYQKAGFCITHLQDGDIYFSFDLTIIP
jgi:GNAT superfamily N-acetyltransferase